MDAIAAAEDHEETLAEYAERMQHIEQANGLKRRQPMADGARGYQIHTDSGWTPAHFAHHFKFAPAITDKPDTPYVFPFVYTSTTWS